MLCSTENVAPCGSRRSENRPTLGMSLGGRSTWPPRFSAAAAAASQSTTEKYTDQYGVSRVNAPVIGIMPPVDSSPDLNTVYGPCGMSIISGFQSNNLV